MRTRALRVAVLGCGSVGSQVVRLLDEQAGDLTARVGAPVQLVGIAVRRIDAPREVEVPPGLLTTDAAGLVARDDVDLHFVHEFHRLSSSLRAFTSARVKTTKPRRDGASRGDA